jgi:diphthine-ammonia ligase
MPQSINIMIHLKVDTQSQPSSPRKALHVQSRSYWAPANIGPYSQAISIVQNFADDQSADIRTVSVAGQIPLIPSTMALPANKVETKFSNTEEIGLENFMLQTVLALQHLWRIGEEMEIRWWASAVAYIPRGSKQEIAAKAVIAGRAWTQIHARMPGDADSGNDEERDLWEEKHYAGMEIWGGAREEKQLPEWSRVEAGRDQEGQSPPFFAVEVEELPRESGIEWHAHLGIIADSIKVGFSRRPSSAMTNNRSSISPKMMAVGLSTNVGLG